LYALIWIATFISTPLTVAQLKFLPIALQISLPILGISLILAIRSINKGQTTTSIGQA
jgi:hypothetical protein